MFCACTAYILGVLLVSPFSSALLVPEDVAVDSDVTFQQFDLATPLQLEMETLVYFQTVGHMLQNVTTSAWLSDEYAVLPFWPTDLSSPPLGASFAGYDQTWKATTAVFQSELICEPMTVEGANLVNYAFSYIGGVNSTDISTSVAVQSMKYEAASGCQYGLAFPNTSATYGGSYWSEVSSMNIPNLWVSIWGKDQGEILRSDNMLFNYTENCQPGEVIVGFTNTSEPGGIHTSAHLCSQKYFIANLTVTATASAGSASLSFDEDLFQRSRAPLTGSMLNTTGFQTQFLNSSWNEYIVSPSQDRPATGGPANLLTTLHYSRTVDKIASADIARDAAKIKQRAFGEALLSSLKSQSMSTNTPGQVIMVERRIVVVQAIAILLEVVLFLQTALFIGVAVSSRVRNRPLGVTHDSALTNTIVSLLASSACTRQNFKHFQSDSSGLLETTLAETRFAISNGALHSSSVQEAEPPSQLQKLRSTRSSGSGQQSGVLNTWMVCGLAGVLLAVMVTVAVLYWYSQHSELSQAAFIYEARVTIAGTTYGKLAPYSIVPTFLAVVLGIWWASVDAVFRKSQPFIDQARAPTTSRNGSGMSYRSSYLLWAALRAVLRNHWLLALVSIGSFLAQILTIAMSALWTRQPSQLSSAVEVSQPLQLRQIPHLQQGWVPGTTFHATNYVGEILSDAFNNLQTNWMYSAAIQLTLNGSEPPWSSNGWSFVPVDLVSTSELRCFQNLGNDSNFSSTRGMGTNATVNTSAIRARLECKPWDTRMRPSQWLTEYDLTNATQWNQTANPKSFEKAYALGCDSGVQPRYINFQPNTSSSATACQYLGGITDFRADGTTVTCCSSGTQDDPGPASIGFWSPSYYQGQYISGWPLLSNGTWPTNITVKWIHGRAVDGYYQAKGGVSPLLWTEEPGIAAADCVPVIETANATVNVNVANGFVQSYRILGDPKADPFAWADDFVLRENPNITARTAGDDNMNVTTSYGVMFIEALLGAASLKTLAGCGDYGCGREYLDDRTFNIRRTGLNVDYMTYSMLSLAQNDSLALLDANNLTSLAQLTFTTFFQHFASMAVSIDGDGGWVYERVGATLPSDLGSPLSGESPNRAPSTSVQFTNTTTLISIERPIEILRMSPLAFALCLGILMWLILTTILILILKKRYFSPLMEKVETIADIAILVAGSERLLRFAAEKGPVALQADKSFKARLGWFRTSTGEVRWGIELIEPGVGFLTEAEAHQLLSSQSGEQSQPARLLEVQDSDQRAFHIDSDA